MSDQSAKIIIDTYRSLLVIHAEHFDALPQPVRVSVLNLMTSIEAEIGEPLAKVIGDDVRIAASTERAVEVIKAAGAELGDDLGGMSLADLLVTRMPELHSRREAETIIATLADRLRVGGDA